MNQEDKIKELKLFLESIKDKNQNVISTIDDATDVIFEGWIGKALKPISKLAKKAIGGSDDVTKLAKKASTKADDVADVAKQSKKINKAKKLAKNKKGGFLSKAGLVATGAMAANALRGEDKEKNVENLESRHESGYTNERRWPTNFHIGSLNENSQREIDDLATLAYRNKRDNELSMAELRSLGQNEYDAQKRFLEVYDYWEDLWNLGEPVAYENQMDR